MVILSHYFIQPFSRHAVTGMKVHKSNKFKYLFYYIYITYLLFLNMSYRYIHDTRVRTVCTVYNT